MRVFFTFLCAVVVINARAHGATLPVFILAGQSNLVGNGDARALPPELSGPSADILYQYDVHTNARYVSDQWGPHVANGGSNGYYVGVSGFGPEVGFAATVAEELGTIGVIKVAQNSTNLVEDWKVGATTGKQLYSRLLGRIDAALSQLPSEYTPEVRGFVWVQGSGDAYTFDGRAQAYDENLQALVDGLRSHVSVADLPVILNIYHEDSARAAHDKSVLRASQLEYANSDPYAVAVNVDDLSLIPNNVHFQQDQYLPLGVRLGEAYLDYVAQQPVLLHGDYNADGMVGQADLDLVLLGWGNGVPPAGWMATNQFDGEQVSQNELDHVLLNWGGENQSTAAVPEPTTLAVSMLGLLGLITCRSAGPSIPLSQSHVG